jgi:hypothetical protein
MDARTETKLSVVAAKPKQAGEVRSRWERTEPSVWTENMLTALETGVKGGKWFSLIDKVWDERNLRAGFEKIFSANSLGFRPGKGCKDALRMVDALLKGGLVWIVDADFKRYFDSIPHERLMAEIENKISDGRILTLIRQYLKQKVMEGFEFLGYRFEKGQRYPRGKSLDKLRDKIRGITRRSNGYGLADIISRLNPGLIGWFGYFKHSHKSIFRETDGWIRMRLRTILRKRQGRKGRAKGTDNHRWPNKFFVEHGLYSLSAAHLKTCQSRC